jgi:NitT/TauT family transport system substrate-binding protein
MPIIQGRRRFLSSLALAGAAGLGGAGSSVAAEPPPEITTIRLQNDLNTCIAPLTVRELLRAEGFNDIRYVDVTEAHIRAADAAGLRRRRTPGRDRQ